MATEKREIHLLTDALRELRMSYDKYFAGQMRLEPVKEREAFEKRLRELKTRPNLTTAARFHLQSLQASYISYSSYWNRLNRQIDEGTFKRDVRRAAKIGQTQPPVQKSHKNDYIFQEKKSGDSIPWLDKIYSDFVEQRKACGQSTKISKKALDKLLRQEASAIRDQTNCGEVRFKVQVKDGRTILKAKPG
jgi:hypothetical protein